MIRHIWTTWLIASLEWWRQLVLSNINLLQWARKYWCRGQSLKSSRAYKRSLLGKARSSHRSSRRKTINWCSKSWLRTVLMEFSANFWITLWLNRDSSHRLQRRQSNQHLVIKVIPGRNSSPCCATSYHFSSKILEMKTGSMGIKCSCSSSTAFHRLLARLNRSRKSWQMTHLAQSLTNWLNIRRAKSTSGISSLIYWNSNSISIPLLIKLSRVKPWPKKQGESATASLLTYLRSAPQMVLSRILQMCPNSLSSKVAEI